MISIIKQTLVGGRYTLHGPLGNGGMAEVFLAHDEVLERDVAVKILKHQYAEDEGFVELFRREAQSAASLNHPHIVVVYDWGRLEDETYYMAMEYVPGGTLKDRIRAEGFLDPYTAVELTSWVAQALGSAHERGMIHRDVKSQNILLAEAGTVKVADFGIARAATATTTSQSNLILGTAGYMSPEQARGGPVGPWSDLYSLGVVLYEMLTGELPYSAEDQVALATKHVNEPPRSPSEANPKVPEVLDALTLRLLAKDPSDRYGSAAELLEDLRQVRGGLLPTSAYDEPLAAKRGVLQAPPQVLENPGGNSMHGRPYVVYRGRFKKVPLALAATSVALLVLLGAAVWGPWWGPEELARAQDVTGGSLDGLGEASGADERTASTKEDEGGYSSKEDSEAGSLPEDEGQRSSELSTGSPTLGDPGLGSSMSVLHDGARGQDSGSGSPAELDSEANAVPGPGHEQVRVPEVRGGSAEEVSQELSDAGHVVEGTANRRSSKLAGIAIGADPAVGPPAEQRTALATVVSSGPTSQEGGNGDEDGEALNADRPVVYEPIPDTEEPPLPPHTRFEQVKVMAQALAKGDPNTLRMVKQSLKGKLQEFHHSLAKAGSRSRLVYAN
ncbi:MAG: protein kinase [Actinobacteria bacterium]|nr:protein kinase [Actinomycetota bacterium]